MKTSHVVALLTIITILGLNSCSKKADDVMPAQTQTTTTPAQPTSSTSTTPTQSTTQIAVGFQVKIDGKLFAPDFNYALASFPGNDTYYAVYGLDSKTSDVVAIALPSTVGEGTYPINTVNVGILTINKADFSTVNGGTGTITITKKTATNLIGTFSFTAYDASGTIKSTLTEGSFNVAFK
jgi:hypothetical protein